jgi:hypothetical protein
MWALVAVPPLRAGLAGMAGLRVDGGEHPVVGDLAGDPPASWPLARLNVLAGDQGQQRDRLSLLGLQPAVGDRRQQRQRVVDQSRHQRLLGPEVIPGALGFARPLIGHGRQPQPGVPTAPAAAPDGSPRPTGHRLGGWQGTCRAVCPLAAHSANYRIDTGQHDRPNHAPSAGS